MRRNIPIACNGGKDHEAIHKGESNLSLFHSLKYYNLITFVILCGILLFLGIEYTHQTEGGFHHENHNITGQNRKS